MRIKPLVVVVILGIGQLSGNAGGWSDADDQEGSTALSSRPCRRVCAPPASGTSRWTRPRCNMPSISGTASRRIRFSRTTARICSRANSWKTTRAANMPENTITYLVDQSDGSALTRTPRPRSSVLPNAVTEPQLDASMAAWDDFQCNGPNVAKVADPGSDPDVVDNLVIANDAGHAFRRHHPRRLVAERVFQRRLSWRRRGFWRPPSRSSLSKTTGSRRLTSTGMAARTLRFVRSITTAASVGRPEGATPATSTFRASPSMKRVTDSASHTSGRSR